MKLENRIWPLWILQFLTAGLLVAWPALAVAQAVVATIPNVGTARLVGVNPVTNKIYVATCSRRFPGFALQGGLSVIDGQTNATTAIPLTGNCAALAVNPVTNKIYVANSVGVTVIDGATNSATTLSSSAGTAGRTNARYAEWTESNGALRVPCTVQMGGLA